MSLSPIEITAVAVEGLLCLCGLAVLARGLLRRSALSTTPLVSWNASPLEFFMLIWVVLVGGLVVQVLALQILRSFSVDELSLRISAGAAFQTGMLAACLGFVFFAEAGKSYSLPRRGFLKQGLAVFVVVIPLVYLSGFLWTRLLHLFGITLNQQELVELFRSVKSPWLLGLMIFLAVVIAPITEELIFRAGIFRYLRSRSPRWVALLVSAALFGSLHMNLASFPQLLILGVVFALAFESSGNIAVPILAHGLFNLNTILLMLIGFDT